MKPLTMLKVDPEMWHCLEGEEPPFPYDSTYLFLGEIPQMPGHCAVVEMKTGHVFSGIHTDNFVELTEDEV